MVQADAEEGLIIVKDRRDTCSWYGGDCGDGSYCSEECEEMTKIEKLKAENAMLRGELKIAMDKISKLDLLKDWAHERYDSEVKNRPLENQYRRILETTWRQIINKIEE